MTNKRFVFYRVAARTDQGTSAGFSFFTNASEAARAAADLAAQDPDEYANELPQIEEIAVRPTKRGILEALNQFAGHPDNG